ncbi:MAG: hypothetical protein IT450_18020 [Phycisphaerales bacterium]|nr:hypothetical protein [Phycisphaerales bacterium]
MATRTVQLRPTISGDTVAELGISRTLDSAAPIGQFICGEPYTVGANTITAKTPAPEGADATARHGDCVNPTMARAVAVAALIGSPFDGRAQAYEADERASFPLAISPGDSIISTESSETTFDPTDSGDYPADATVYPVYYSQGSTTGAVRPIKSLSILTCLAEAPSRPTFRPPATGSSKPLFTRANLSLDFILNLNLELPAGATAPTYNDLMRVLQYPHLATGNQHTTYDWSGWVNTQCVYSREFRLAYYDALLLCCLDVLSETQKRRMLERIVQQGIDHNYASLIDEELYAPNGGHQDGHKGIILFTRKALGKTAHPDWDLTGRTFAEDEHYGYASDFSRTVQTSSWSASAHAYATDVIFGVGGLDGPSMLRETYDPDDWHLAPFNAAPWTSNRPWNRHEGYGRLNAQTVCGQAIFERITDLVAEHDCQAFFDFADRWMYDDDDAATLAKFRAAAIANDWNTLDTEDDWTEDPATNVWFPAAQSSLSPFQKAMFLEYRGGI